MCFNRIDGDGDGDDAVIPRGNRVPVRFPLAEPVTPAGFLFRSFQRMHLLFSSCCPSSVGSKNKNHSTQDSHVVPHRATNYSISRDFRTRQRFGHLS